MRTFGNLDEFRKQNPLVHEQAKTVDKAVEGIRSYSEYLSLTDSKFLAQVPKFQQPTSRKVKPRGTKRGNLRWWFLLIGERLCSIPARWNPGAVPASF